MADVAPPKQLGKYRPIKKLGAGGMGVVYLAEDVELGRTVALKVLPKRPDMPANLIARFRSEARAAARLHHPGIVTVFDSGETDRALYIALEYVDGKDVDRLLKTRTRLPPKRATDLVRQVAEALVHLHEKGIVHRDIKPSNIMVRRDGSAVLADLGLARAVEEEAEGGITRAGYTVGTVDYMAPEQAKNSRNADIRSDLYSLGCSWFHMLTGRIPYPGDSLTAKLSAHDHDPIPDPRSLHSDIPDSYTAVLQRAMAKDPAERYATPQEFLDDLELARKRRGSVSSDLLKDLADSHEDDVAALLADQEQEAEAGFTGEEDEEDAPVRRRAGRKRKGKAARPTPVAGELPVAAPGTEVDDGEDEYEVDSAPRRRPGKKRNGTRGQAVRPTPLASALPLAGADDDDDSSPRRRTPAGAPKDYKKGLDPLLVRNLLVGGGLLLLLVGVGLLAAYYGGAFGDPSRVVERPGGGADAPAAADAEANANAPDAPAPAATLVREADDRPKPAAPPSDPAAAPSWVAELPPARGPEVTVVAGAADPNPTGAPRAVTLAAALARLPAAGGTVTLRGVGPFTLPRLDLPEGAHVRIRADGGEEPVVNAAPLPPNAAGWLRARGGSLTLDGLHVTLPARPAPSAGGQAGPAPALIEAAAATAIFRGGSVTSQGDAPAVAVRAAGGGKTAAHVLLDGTVLRGNALTGVSLAGGQTDLFARDCLLACGDGPAVVFPPDASADADSAAEPNRTAPRGGAVHFIAHRTASAAQAPASAKGSAPARRSARFVDCVGLFRQAAVAVLPGPGEPPAVTLAGCAFGAAPGADAVPLLAPPDAEVKWTVQGGALAGLVAPAGLQAPGRSAGWEGDPIADFAAVDPAAFAPARLDVAPGAAPAGWRLPAPAAAARAAAATRLPAEPEAWSQLFPDAPVVETTAVRLDDELAKKHPDGTTLVVTGSRRVRIRPALLSGRSLRIVGLADEEGDTPLLTASTAAGGTPTLLVQDGRLELVNLTLEAREDSTGAGALVAVEGAAGLAVIRRCELRAGSGEAPAVRVRGGSAVLSGTLLLGEGAAGLLTADRGGVSLSECGLVTPGPAALFGPDGAGVVALTRCAISVGGPVFDASGGSGTAAEGAAVAITDRCLFLPPPPGGPGRVALSAGGATVWGTANAFATAYAPPPPAGAGPPGPAGGERNARTGPSAVVLERPRVPDWKVVDARDLAPAAGSAAATDGLGAGPGLGPAADVIVAGLPTPPKSATPGGTAPRPTVGPNF
ncbi:serine/threonine-protein kinase [Alienimonas californiensis]|uniref:non-specific serine/threonine protein kinase n=1 Tax=Alienimonas californiensis TaxID=2527989 RepID=A0A517PAS8_9PLAN|nr:serine/threonine-protein kinase [Alienimonas californiensis]QDT16485.1 Serine/threonine-protein kinase StkP [Alienimonas californiensis]